MINTILKLFVYLIFPILQIQAQSCSESQKCATTACCSKWGNCGYGPDFCGEGCLHDCSAEPECGKYSSTPDCPLKVCCGQYGFCGTTPEFCGNGCQSNCGEPPVPSCSPSDSKLRIGYYASWSAKRKCQPFTVENIDPRNYTHLNYAFGTISNGVLVIPSQDSEEGVALHKFSQLKRINQELRVLVSVGGWAFNDPGPTRQEFHNIALNRESRERFINSVREFLNVFDFDGIDIDWEYPVAEDRGGSKEDKDNYVELVKQMRDSFQSSKLITIAAPASYWYLRHFKIGAMSDHLDWINVMTYDFHGVWDKDTKELGPYVRPHTDMKQIDNAFKLFWKDGVRPEKLVLGLGYYGRSFTLKDAGCNKIGCEFSGPAEEGRCTAAAGILAWFEINEIISENKLNPSYEAEAASKVLTWRNQWVAYDDEHTLRLKTEWAGKVCAKGVMIWSIDQGIDRIRDGQTLPGGGSITLAKFHFRPDYLVPGAPPAWILEYDRDSSLGYDAYVITVENVDTPKRRKRQSQPQCRVNAIENLYAAWVLASLFYRQSSGPQGQIGSTDAMHIDEHDNPITSVDRRLIGFARNNQPVYRTELLRATIHPWHISQVRRDFTSDFVYDHLGGIRGMDDRGHIVGSYMGGPGGTNNYNLFPQYWRINQHSSNSEDWVAMEREVRRFFAQNSAGWIDYVVVLHYPQGQLNTGRPQSIAWALVFSDGSEASGVVTNADPSGNDVPRP